MQASYTIGMEGLDPFCIRRMSCTFWIKVWTHSLTKMALGTDESWTCKTGAVLKLSTNRLLGFSTRAEPALRLRAKLVANDDCSAFKMLKTTAGVTNFDFCVMMGYDLWSGNTSLP
ncbi:hypothetical protein TNCV_4706921 [Trichonephila clavipes]|nr:hypothetical protein TNCV_4706921 [Trichonephila clavipes]